MNFASVEKRRHNSHAPSHPPLKKLLLMSRVSFVRLVACLVLCVTVVSMSAVFVFSSLTFPNPSPISSVDEGGSTDVGGMVIADELASGDVNFTRSRLTAADSARERESTSNTRSEADLPPSLSSPALSTMSAPHSTSTGSSTENAIDSGPHHHASFASEDISRLSDAVAAIDAFVDIPIGPEIRRVQKAVSYASLAERHPSLFPLPTNADDGSPRPAAFPKADLLELQHDGRIQRVPRVAERLVSVLPLDYYMLHHSLVRSSPSSSASLLPPVDTTPADTTVLASSSLAPFYDWAGLSQTIYLDGPVTADGDGTPITSSSPRGYDAIIEEMHECFNYTGGGMRYYTAPAASPPSSRPPRCRPLPKALTASAIASGYAAPSDSTIVPILDVSAGGLTVRHAGGKDGGQAPPTRLPSPRQQEFHGVHLRASPSLHSRWLFDEWRLWEGELNTNNGAMDGMAAALGERGEQSSPSSSSSSSPSHNSLSAFETVGEFGRPHATVNGAHTDSEDADVQNLRETVYELDYFCIEEDSGSLVEFVAVQGEGAAGDGISDHNHRRNSTVKSSRISPPTSLDECCYRMNNYDRFFDIRNRIQVPLVAPSPSSSPSLLGGAQQKLQWRDVLAKSIANYYYYSSTNASKQWQRQQRRDSSWPFAAAVTLSPSVMFVEGNGLLVPADGGYQENNGHTYYRIATLTIMKKLLTISNMAFLVDVAGPDARLDGHFVEIPPRSKVFSTHLFDREEPPEESSKDAGGGDGQGDTGGGGVPSVFVKTARTRHSRPSSPFLLDLGTASLMALPRHLRTLSEEARIRGGGYRWAGMSSTSRGSSSKRFAKTRGRGWVEGHGPQEGWVDALKAIDKAVARIATIPNSTTTSGGTADDETLPALAPLSAVLAVPEMLRRWVVHSALAADATKQQRHLPSPPSLQWAAEVTDTHSDAQSLHRMYGPLLSTGADGCEAFRCGGIHGSIPVGGEGVGAEDASSSSSSVGGARLLHRRCATPYIAVAFARGRTLGQALGSSISPPAPLPPPPAKWLRSTAERIPALALARWQMHRGALDDEATDAIVAALSPPPPPDRDHDLSRDTVNLTRMLEQFIASPSGSSIISEVMYKGDADGASKAAQQKRLVRLLHLGSRGGTVSRRRATMGKTSSTIAPAVAASSSSPSSSSSSSSASNSKPPLPPLPRGGGGDAHSIAVDVAFDTPDVLPFVRDTHNHSQRVWTSAVRLVRREAKRLRFDLLRVREWAVAVRHTRERRGWKGRRHTNGSAAADANGGASGALFNASTFYSQLLSSTGGGWSNGDEQTHLNASAAIDAPIAVLADVYSPARAAQGTSDYRAGQQRHTGGAQQAQTQRYSDAPPELVQYILGRLQYGPSQSQENGKGDSTATAHYAYILWWRRRLILSTVLGRLTTQGPRADKRELFALANYFDELFPILLEVGEMRALEGNPIDGSAWPQSEELMGQHASDSGADVQGAASNTAATAAAAADDDNPYHRPQLMCYRRAYLATYRQLKHNRYNAHEDVHYRGQLLPVVPSNCHAEEAMSVTYAAYWQRYGSCDATSPRHGGHKDASTADADGGETSGASGSAAAPQLDTNRDAHPLFSPALDWSGERRVLQEAFALSKGRINVILSEGAAAIVEALGAMQWDPVMNASLLKQHNYHGGNGSGSNHRQKGDDFGDYFAYADGTDAHNRLLRGPRRWAVPSSVSQLLRGLASTPPGLPPATPSPRHPSLPGLIVSLIQQVDEAQRLYDLRLMRYFKKANVKREEEEDHHSAAPAASSGDGAGAGAQQQQKRASSASAVEGRPIRIFVPHRARTRAMVNIRSIFTRLMMDGDEEPSDMAQPGGGGAETRRRSKYSFQDYFEFEFSSGQGSSFASPRDPLYTLGGGGEKEGGGGGGEGNTVGMAGRTPPTTGRARLLNVAMSVADIFMGVHGADLHLMAVAKPSVFAVEITLRGFDEGHRFNAGFFAPLAFGRSIGYLRVLGHRQDTPPDGLLEGTGGVHFGLTLPEYRQLHSVAVCSWLATNAVRLADEMRIGGGRASSSSVSPDTSRRFTEDFYDHLVPWWCRGGPAAVVRSLLTAVLTHTNHTSNSISSGESPAEAAAAMKEGEASSAAHHRRRRHHIPTTAKPLLRHMRAAEAVLRPSYYTTRTIPSGVGLVTPYCPPLEPQVAAERPPPSASPAVDVSTSRAVQYAVGTTTIRPADLVLLQNHCAANVTSGAHGEAVLNARSFAKNYTSELLERDTSNGPMRVVDDAAVLLAQRRRAALRLKVEGMQTILESALLMSSLHAQRVAMAMVEGMRGGSGVGIIKFAAVRNSNAHENCTLLNHSSQSTVLIGGARREGSPPNEHDDYDYFATADEYSPLFPVADLVGNETCGEFSLNTDEWHNAFRGGLYAKTSSRKSGSTLYPVAERLKGTEMCVGQMVTALLDPLRGGGVAGDGGTSPLYPLVSRRLVHFLNIIVPMPRRSSSSSSTTTLFIASPTLRGAMAQWITRQYMRVVAVPPTAGTVVPMFTSEFSYGANCSRWMPHAEEEAQQWRDQKAEGAYSRRRRGRDDSQRLRDLMTRYYLD